MNKHDEVKKSDFVPDSRCWRIKAYGSKPWRLGLGDALVLFRHAYWAIVSVIPPATIAAAHRDVGLALGAILAAGVSTITKSINRFVSDTRV